MKKNEIYAVILAGGSGTRFWPLSRQKHPKQFLNIVGGKSLLVQTVERIRPLVSSRNIIFVTNKDYKAEISRQVRPFGIPASNILLEPQARNTAPAIGWAAAKIHEMDPNAVMMVLPSDHLISKVKAYHGVLRKAAALAKKGVLVTFGIKPSRPETGYGYIKTKNAVLGGTKTLKVDQFKEKPDLKTARRYLKAGNYYWNSGMFIWKASAIMDAFKEFLPAIHKHLPGNTGPQKVKKIWNKLTKISIDYGILEKAKNVYCVPAENIGWSDLGSWESLAEVLPSDKQGNSLNDKSLVLDCRNTSVTTTGTVVAAVGLEDVVVAVTDDAVLVCRRQDSQKVKDVLENLKSEKKWKHLT